MSRLDLVVGPDGAGKSTFVELVLAETRPGVPFVNADVTAAERWRADPLSHGREAARPRGPPKPFVAGEIVGAPSWPDWTPEALTRLPASGDLLG